MGLNTDQVIKDLEATLTTVYNQSREATPVSWQKFALRQDFASSRLVLGWMESFPDLREWVGERVVHDINVDGYTVYPSKFELTHGVDLDDLDDSIIANAANVMRRGGEAAARHPQKLLTELFKNGRTGVCYDGQPFFSTDHPVSGVGAVSNLDVGNSTPWILAKGDTVFKPLVFGVRVGRDYQLRMHRGADKEFFENKIYFGVDARVAAAYGLWQFAYMSTKTLDFDNLEAAFTAMTSIKGENGVEIDNEPNLLIVPPSLRLRAEKLITREKTGNGDNIFYKRFEIVVLPGLQNVPDSELPGGGEGGDNGDGGEE